MHDHVVSASSGIPFATAAHSVLGAEHYRCRYVDVHEINYHFLGVIDIILLCFVARAEIYSAADKPINLDHDSGCGVRRRGAPAAGE